MDFMTLAWQVAQVLLIGLGVGLPFLVLACLAGMWEKQLVWPYVPCDDHELPPPNDYSRLMNRMAEGQEFRHLATTRHGGGKLYKVRYDLRLSPDREVLAVIGSGTMAAIAYQVHLAVHPAGQRPRPDHARPQRRRLGRPDGASTLLARAPRRLPRAAGEASGTVWRR